MRGAGRSSDDTRKGVYIGNAAGSDATLAAAGVAISGPVDDGLGDQGAGDLRLHDGLLGIPPLPLSIVGAVLSMVLLWPIAFADPKPLTLWFLGGAAAAVVALTYSSRVIRAGRAERSSSWAIGRVVWIAVVATLVAVPLIWLLA